ncbi:phthiocerol/phenolphthiocerol synthesis type-I polyketide synthase C [Microdochium nivale]|nr:phthiocerol/phenolphthiocerol synthesis type-I polyketide synthase C [Microdochium nivale]
MTTLKGLSAHSRDVLLFGWQARSLDEEKLASIHRVVHSSSANSWIIDAVVDLPAQLALLTSISKEFNERAGTLLGHLVRWLRDGEPPHGADFVRYNTLLTPLTIIHHLLQYSTYLDAKYPHHRPDARFTAARGTTESLGFCTGLISAYAVSSASDVESFRAYGAIAIRMAMACGLVVDQLNYSNHDTQTTSIAVVWQSSEAKQGFEKVLAAFPNTYRSVLFDHDRSTITVARHEKENIEKELRRQGLNPVSLDFDGRFHWPHHDTAAQELMSFMDDEPLLHSHRESGTLSLPVSAGADQVTSKALHHSVIRSVLLDAPDWYRSVLRVQQQTELDSAATFITFGSENLIPPSLLRSLKGKLLSMTDFERQQFSKTRLPWDTDIAVVGMACKVAGAEDLDEFWQILCKGKSQHKRVPEDRFKFDTPYRQHTKDKPWFGNFVDDHDTFDHKFFNKTPREAASMDPQQRQFLQIAYQAVEQSGYFRKGEPDRRVGCYVGMSSVDYENNVACHAPNAYSATGTLRGFVAGKVSHFFGWTGPGLTLDTACSSSAVAVHLACQAILNDECSAAVAGGVNIMTSPLFFQNLAGASFLSKTGQCKPFDAAADGYCRGEGCGAVFLKKLSAAIADGDTVHGVIAATAVQQNENCTPIVVPNVPSLSDLFHKVVAKSRLRLEQIGVVEAHGTGTPVGDPAEYESIRSVLGGISTGRNSQLMLGSVKGLVGHLEATSGIISLIKSLLMIKYGAVPPQASFNRLNPAINAVASDRITIPTAVTPWITDLKAVLINNYGASGSNASIVVIDAPLQERLRSIKPVNGGSFKTPFRITGLDSSSLAAYAVKLHAFVTAQHPATTIADLAFRIVLQSNPTLPEQHVFTARTTAELSEQLFSLANGRTTSPSVTRQKKSAPVVLCFGGQVAKSVGLDRVLFESCLVLKRQLDKCDCIAQSVGAGTIYPHIFQREPINDIVTLQTCLFSIQFASAQAWIECGIRPAAVVGHSFGELTAMAVAGVLSASDAMKIVVTRARLIRDQWPADKGGMLAVETSIDDVRLLLQITNAAVGENAANPHPLVIACYNGPRSFTLAGSAAAVDRAEQIVAGMMAASVKMRRLNVTNAFHSTLTGDLVASLDEAAAGMKFAPPKIEWERCTESKSTGDPLSALFFGQHLRQPVFFDHAIRRIAARHPQCVWLESGSNSTITNIINRALGRPQNNTFVPSNLSAETSCSNLADTTAALWTAGVDVTFWPHHLLQSGEYASLILPPYQFAKSRHWLELKAAPIVVAPMTPKAETPPVTWLTFMGYQDGVAQRHARFRINTDVERFRILMAGHKTAQTAPICPATVQMDIALDAMSQIVSIGPDFNPEITDISNTAPICDNPNTQLWLDLQTSGTTDSKWRFTVSSTDSKNIKDKPTVHTTGAIVPSAKNLSTETDLARYERVVSHNRCLEVLNCPEPDETMQGRVIYKAFADVVDYDEQYRGVARLVGKDSASAGRVVKKPNTASWFDAHLSDSFCQVGGIFLNCMTDRSPSDIFICRGMERWMRSARLQQSRPSVYDVLALHNGSVESGSFLTDVFVFDPSTGSLVEAILGLNFVKVQKQAIAKTLIRLTGATPTLASRSAVATTAMPKLEPTVRLPLTPTHAAIPVGAVIRKSKPMSLIEDDGLLMTLKTIISELAGITVAEIQPTSDLADLGIDSLMAMELVRELEISFKCTISLDDASNVSTMPQLVAFVRAVTGTSPGRSSSYESDSTDSDDQYEISLGSSLGLSTITPPESVTSTQRVDIIRVLAELVGIDASELSPGSVLCELGVDSLMSMEIHSVLSSEWGVRLGDDIAVEKMTVLELDLLVNGPGVAVTSAAIDGLAQTLDTLPPTDESPKKAALTLELETVLAAFGSVKSRTDQQVEVVGCAAYVTDILPKQDELCVALTLEAFEQMGCDIKQASSGQTVRLPVYSDTHKQLVRHLCRMIEKRTGVLTCVDDTSVTMTSQSYSIRHSSVILQELHSVAPQEATANDLIYYVGSNLAELLRGKTDGIKLIFGCERGRSLVAEFYAEWPLHRMCYLHAEAFFDNLTKQLSLVSSDDGVLKIMEMGAGTGGTTRRLLPLLARIGRPVEYIFTDVSSSLVIQARKRYQATYPFMRFQTHDIEKNPSPELVSSQHVVISSNAVHATADLVRSTANIRKLLQPNGVLLMVEMTSPPFWVDLVFGVFKGWWLFDDGRSHALADEHRWQKALEAAGFGWTDWTAGSKPETEVERLIIAVNGGSRQQRQAVSPPLLNPAHGDGRQAAVDKYIDRICSGLCDAPAPRPTTLMSASLTQPMTCILVTGGTGSLGSHLVANLAERADVGKVVILNRKHSINAMERQLEALRSRHISLSAVAQQKLRVFATDSSKPNLGFAQAEYAELTQSVTHIVHSAWAMSIKRPIYGFQAQFDIMHNLIRLAWDAAASQPLHLGYKIHFQFISSIAVVGHYPLRPGRHSPRVPEERVELRDVLPHGYGDAKYACERALDETLHRHPSRFATGCVRIGQIAGASTGPGYWNPHEHIPFLLKSSQTLRCLPQLKGTLSWTPVDVVAGTLADLVMSADTSPWPIYHIDNPVRQLWADILPILAESIQIGLGDGNEVRQVPFQQWLKLVQSAPASGPDGPNPACLLVDFLQDEFERMSCGGLELETAHTQEHSLTLARTGPVDDVLVRKYISEWKRSKFL